MRIFGFGNNKKSNNVVFDKAELFRKEKEKEPMTVDELEALRREKERDLVNQILQILGLITLLVLVILSVGTTLYKYSLFNLFGPTKFWDAYNNMQVYTHGEYRDLETVINAVMHGGVYLDLTTDVDPNVGFVDVFYMLGGWTIIPISTIGLVAVIIVTVYVFSYSINNLFKVIKHFANRTDYVVTDIGKSLAASLELPVNTKNNKKKATVKKGKKENKETPSTKKDVSDIITEEEELNKKVEQYKSELKNDKTPNIQAINTTEDLKNQRKTLHDLSDEELDNMLK